MIQNRTLQIRASDEFFRLVDAWRREQDDLPTRAAAVRRLVERQLAEEKVRVPAPDRKPGR
jgi:hypothetical protein